MGAVHMAHWLTNATRQYMHWLVKAAAMMQAQCHQAILV